MFGAAVALIASATPTPEVRRSLPDAIDAAIDYCAASAFGASATLDGRLAIFTYAEGQMAEILRRQGQKTTAEVPDLIKRFAATAQNSRSVGHRDIVAIEAGDGIVWLVMTANKHLCDIAITGIDDASGIPSDVAGSVTGDNGWRIVAENNDDVLWSSSFKLDVQAGDGEKQQANIYASGLVGELAKPDGIQAEINFGANQTGPNAVEDN